MYAQIYKRKKIREKKNCKIFSREINSRKVPKDIMVSKDKLTDFNTRTEGYFVKEIFILGIVLASNQLLFNGRSNGVPLSHTHSLTFAVLMLQAFNQLACI